jgi:hypothetical protein
MPQRISAYQNLLELIIQLVIQRQVFLLTLHRKNEQRDGYKQRELQITFILAGQNNRPRSIHYKQNEFHPLIRSCISTPNH